MSIKINAQIASSSEYVTAVREMCHLITSRAIHPLQIFETTFMFTSGYRKEKEYLKTLHGYTESVIKTRRAELIKENDAGTEFKRRPSFLDLLLQSTIDGRPLTNEEIRQEVDTFMFEVRKWLHFKIFLYKELLDIFLCRTRDSPNRHHQLCNVKTFLMSLVTLHNCFCLLQL